VCSQASPMKLSAYAQASLGKRSASRSCSASPVTDCNRDGVVYGGNKLDAKTIIWAAGRAPPRLPPNGSARRPTVPGGCRSNLT